MMKIKTRKNTARKATQAGGSARRDGPWDGPPILGGDESRAGTTRARPDGDRPSGGHLAGRRAEAGRMGRGQGRAGAEPRCRGLGDRGAPEARLRWRSNVLPK